MSEDTTVDSPQSTNGRVYLDGVVASTRAAAAPKKRRSIGRLLIPAVVAGAAIVAFRRLRAAID
jgi:hypothetical protein